VIEQDFFFGFLYIIILYIYSYDILKCAYLEQLVERELMKRRKKTFVFSINRMWKSSRDGFSCAISRR